MRDEYQNERYMEALTSVQLHNNQQAMEEQQQHGGGPFTSSPTPQGKPRTEISFVQPSPSKSPSAGRRSPALTDIKEEPAAKRTQMWLAQLGRYRQKSLQEEIDRNQEDLWQEQIARAVTNPVKSPLEPEEITLCD